MKENLVTTVRGEEVEISKCRYIDKKYYKVGDVNIKDSGDCYLIEGRYVRYDTGHIEFDHETNVYVRPNVIPLVYGIVDFDKNKSIYGHFSANPLKNAKVTLETKETVMCISEDLLANNLAYREELATGNYYHISTKRAFGFGKIPFVSKAIKEGLPYDSRGILDNQIEIFKKNYKPKISKAVAKYSKLLKDLTFGLEFETTKGIVPKNKLNILPLIALRDGSIPGLEYVTIPLTGEIGVQSIIDTAKELDKRTEYDNSCALHMHIGNIPRTKEFILAFYKLASHLQDDLFAMFPLYKKYNFGVKRKNYSKPFPLNKLNALLDAKITKENIDENFNVLYEYLSVGQSFYDVGCDLRNVKSHPSDPHGTAKWNINTRYYAINLIPLLFGNKETIEFRIHTPTYDIDKILCFLFINSILLNYTIQYEKHILQNKGWLAQKDLINIIRDYINANLKGDGNVFEDYIIDYIGVRTEITFRQNCNGNIVGNEEEIKCSPYINWTDHNFSLNQNRDELLARAKELQGNEIELNNNRDNNQLIYDNKQLMNRIDGQRVLLSNGQVYRFEARRGDNGSWILIDIRQRPNIDMRGNVIINNLPPNQVRQPQAFNNEAAPRPLWINRPVGNRNPPNIPNQGFQQAAEQMLNERLEQQHMDNAANIGIGILPPEPRVQFVNGGGVIADEEPHMDFGVFDQIADNINNEQVQDEEIVNEWDDNEIPDLP